MNTAEITYSLTILITKLSILLLYLRVFMPIRQSKINRLTHFIVWFNILLYLSIVLVSCTGCIPRRKVWQPWVQGQLCQ